MLRSHHKLDDYFERYLTIKLSNEGYSIVAAQRQAAIRLITHASPGVTGLRSERSAEKT